MLILDAFNSDAIPAHLLSREAVNIYKTKLKLNGAVLFHVSNRYLRVRELVTALARDAGLPALYREDNDISEFGKARWFCERFMEQNILCKDAHEDVIRFAPPLIIEKQEIDWAMERIGLALKSAKSK